MFNKILGTPLTTIQKVSGRAVAFLWNLLFHGGKDQFNVFSVFV